MPGAPHWKDSYSVKSVGPLIWVVLLAGVFYLMIIRPNRNRQRAQQQMSERLGVGARVMTTSGLFAEVVGFAAAVVGASFRALRRNDGMADGSELRVGSGTGIAGRG